MRLRAASAGDAGFLRRMVAAAADWRAGAAPRPVDEVLADPAVAHYVTGWPQPGDFGVIAEDASGRPLGAAWCRAFPPDEPGYGFVAPDVPELSIAVVADARGQGIGRRLLDELVREARRRRIARLSLSVERDNPALGLYETAGFAVIGDGGGALTMTLDTRPGALPTPPGAAPGS